MAGMTGTGSPRRICGRVLLVALVCTVSVAVGLDASPALGVASHAGADHDHRDAHDGHGRGDDESAAWRVYGHDLANTRTNTDEHAINRRTVAGLTEQWSKDGLVGVSGTPAVSHGVAYFADWTGTVWAVRAATGQTIWTTKLGGPFVAAPALGHDSVYVATGATLFSLDRDTGALRWKVVTDPDPIAQISASPVVVGDLVIQGVASAGDVVAPAKYTFRGSIAAYDARTGALVWRFFATANDATSGPGVGIWSTPAVDREHGLLYVGTGNTFVEPNAPLADALLAIDLHTGKLVWSHQFTAPDIFSGKGRTGPDADVGASPNLWSDDGRDFVGVGDKAGTYHAFERHTGKLVWEDVLTPGSAFGGVLGSASYTDGELLVPSNVGNPATNFPTGVAKVFALDPETGAHRWVSPDLPGKILGPVSAVHGVVFVPTDSSQLFALDTRTGAQLWTFRAPAQSACGPSIVDGRVLWGYGFTLFSGSGPGGILSFSLPHRR